MEIIVRLCLCGKMLGCYIDNKRNDCVSCLKTSCVLRYSKNHPISNGLCNSCFVAVMNDKEVVRSG